MVPCAHAARPPFWQAGRQYELPVGVFTAQTYPLRQVDWPVPVHGARQVLCMNPKIDSVTHSAPPAHGFVAPHGAVQ